jgi:hypothetical protein
MKLLPLIQEKLHHADELLKAVQWAKNNGVPARVIDAKSTSSHYLTLTLPDAKGGAKGVTVRFADHHAGLPGSINHGDADYDSYELHSWRNILDTMVFDYGLNLDAHGQLIKPTPLPGSR